MLNKEYMLEGTKKTAIPVSIVIGNFTDSGDKIHTGFAFGYPLSYLPSIGSIDKHPIWVIDGKEYTLSLLETYAPDGGYREATSRIALNLVEANTPDDFLDPFPWDMHVKTDFGNILFPKIENGYADEDFFLPEYEGETIQVTFDPLPDKYKVSI